MKRVPGMVLSYALHKMTTVQIQSVVSELSRYLAQMHQLIQRAQAQSPVSQTLTIGGAAQGPGYNHRLGPYVWGPFSTVAHFHSYTRFGEPLEDWVHEPAVIEVHGKPEGKY
jgi:hypothetical protein